MTTPLLFMDFELLVEERKLLKQGAPVALGARAFDILSLLAGHAGKLMSKEIIFARVWPGLVVEENNLQVHVSALRKVLGRTAIATIPGRGYRFAAPVHAQAAIAHVPPGVPRGDAIARTLTVLPFHDRRHTKASDNLSEGLADGVTHALSRSRWLQTLAAPAPPAETAAAAHAAKTSASPDACFLLTGSIFSHEHRLRIVATLTERRSGKVLWSQRYDRAESDAFALQDDLADQMVSAIEPVCLRCSEEQSRTVGGSVPERWEALMKARWHLWRSSPYHLAHAERLLKRQLQLEANDATALALLSCVHTSRAWTGWTKDPEINVNMAHRLAVQAVRADDMSCFAHTTLGTALSMKGCMSHALAELDHAVGLYPQCAGAVGERARLLVFSGRTGEAREAAERAIHSSPQHPLLALWLRTSALSWLLDGHLQKAVSSALRATACRPDWFFNHYLLAACQHAAGDRMQARLSLTEGERLARFPLRAFELAHPFTRHDSFSRFFATLREVGWRP